MNKFDKIVIQDIFGNPVALKGKILSYKEYGFNTTGGGWCISRLHDADKPAKFMLFKPYRKQKNIAINIRDIIESIPGFYG